MGLNDVATCFNSGCRFFKMLSCENRLAGIINVVQKRMVMWTKFLSGHELNQTPLEY